MGSELCRRDVQRKDSRSHSLGNTNGAAAPGGAGGAAANGHCLTPRIHEGVTPRGFLGRPLDPADGCHRGFHLPALLVRLAVGLSSLPLWPAAWNNRKGKS